MKVKDKRGGHGVRRLIFDFGSENVRMGIDGSRRPPLSEPAVVAHRGPDDVVAVGEQAFRMLGRTPDGLEAERPFTRGGVRSQKLAEALVRSLMVQAGGHHMRRPEMWIALGAGASPIDRRGLGALAQRAGAARVHFISLSACKALGLELPLFEPTGSLLVDVGASCTRIDLLSLGHSVARCRVEMAGDHIDEAISRLMRERYNLMVGPATAQAIKHALLGEGQEQATANGRDLVTGLPQSVLLARDELLPPIEQLADQIANGVRELLRDVSPELVSDLAAHGFHLTGGGARLMLLGDLLQDRLDLPLHRDPEPEATVCKGLQLALEPKTGRLLRLRSA